MGDQPPARDPRRRHLLAINNHLYTQDVFWPPATFLPPTIGAGLWFRRLAYDSAIGTSAQGLIADRTGSSMVGGGDIEIGHRFSAAGYTSALAYELDVEHAIPSARLETRYFVRLITGVVRSEETLQQKYAASYSPFRRRVDALVRLAGVALISPLLLLRKNPFGISLRRHVALGARSRAVSVGAAGGLNLLDSECRRSRLVAPVSGGTNDLLELVEHASSFKPLEHHLPAVPRTTPRLLR